MRSSVVGRVLEDAPIFLVIGAGILFVLFMLIVAIKSAADETEHQRRKAEFIKPCVLEQQLSEKTCEERWKWMQR
jgi:hypothetical protein